MTLIKKHVFMIGNTSKNLRQTGNDIIEFKIGITVTKNRLRQIDSILSNVLFHAIHDSHFGIQIEYMRQLLYGHGHRRLIDGESRHGFFQVSVVRLRFVIRKT